MDRSPYACSYVQSTHNATDRSATPYRDPGRIKSTHAPTKTINTKNTNAKKLQALRSQGWRVDCVLGHSKGAHIVLRYASVYGDVPKVRVVGLFD